MGLLFLQTTQTDPSIEAAFESFRPLSLFFFLFYNRHTHAAFQSFPPLSLFFFLFFFLLSFYFFFFFLFFYKQHTHGSINAVFKSFHLSLALLPLLLLLPPLLPLLYHISHNKRQTRIH